MNPTPDPLPIREVSAAEFESEILRSQEPVLVAFGAPWSVPCQVVDSVLTEVATACAGQVSVVKVNADDHPDLSLWYEIQSIPTLLLFVNGNPRARVVGTASKEAILGKLRASCQGIQLTLPVSKTDHEPTVH